jgi:hypothetical protein
VRGFRYVGHRPAESDLVWFGGPREAAQFPDELQGRGMDFLVRGRQFQIVQSLAGIAALLATKVAIKP